MTVEFGVGKDDLEKTIAVDQKIETAATCVEALSLAAIFINPLTIIPTVLASAVGYAADRQIASNRKKQKDISSKCIEKAS